MRVPSLSERRPVDPKEMECRRDGCREHYLANGLCFEHYIESVKRFEKMSSEVHLRVGAHHAA